MSDNFFLSGPGKWSDVTLARKAVAHMGGPGTIATRIIQVDANTIMRVRTRNGWPEVTIEKKDSAGGDSVTVYYMSSGAYVLGTYDVLDPSLTPNVILHKSDPVASNELLSVATLFKTPTPLSGDDSRLYNATAISGSSLNDAKIAMYGTRPSMFSGLMRRMVQGRYGTAQTELKIGVYSGDEGSDTRISFGYSYGSTTGIVRFDKAYFIVEIVTSDTNLKVYGCPLSLPATLLAKMDSSPDASQKAAYETLALAHAKTNQALRGLIAEYTVPAGLPVGYGWNFSLTTNKADVVVRYNPGYAYDRNTWSHLRASFGYSAAGGLSCALSMPEQGDGWSLAARSPIWVSAGATTNWVNLWHSTPDPLSSQDFPVYAYYVADELFVVRFGWSGSDTPYDDAAWVEKVAKARHENSVFGAGSGSFSVSGAFGVQATHGYYMAGKSSPVTTPATEKTASGSTNIAYSSPPATPPSPVSVAGPGASLGSYALKAYYTSYNPFIWPTGPIHGFAPADPYPGNPNRVFSIISSSGTETNETSDSTRSHMTCLIIPSFDCSAVFIGAKTEKNGSRNTHTVTGGGQSRVDEWYSLAELPEGTTEWPIMGMWGTATLRQFPAGYSPDFFGDATSVDDPITERTYSMQLWGYSNPVVYGGDLDFYHPSVEAPYVNVTVSALSASIYRDMRYTSGEMTDDSNTTTSGYPTAIHAFVGAA